MQQRGKKDDLLIDIPCIELYGGKMEMVIIIHVTHA